MKSIPFVQQVFRKYYAKGFSLETCPSEIEKREFGFAMFEGWMLRHKSFEAIDELAGFLEETAPRDAYFSCAYYEDPETEMDKKGWTGADLVFDIDADHVPTSCDKFHDQWTCCKCGFTGKGVTPENCPVCGSEKFDEETWPCEVCLSSAKDETVKLLDMLMNDFGFSERELSVFFSGHRGYHVHVGDSAVKDLDSIARKEIVDYICGLGLDIRFQVADEKGKGTLRMNDLGWRGRTAKGTYNLVSKAGAEEYKKIGLRGNVVNILIKNRPTILGNLSKSEPWNAINGVGPGTWKKIVEYSAMSQSSTIDTVVTTDTHRLMRLGETLNGKTGLKKTCFPISAIETFDPFKSAVAFKEGTAIVSISYAPRFRIGDETFGPYKNSKVELPMAAALLLICRNRAEATD